MPTLYSSVFGGFEFPWPPLRQPRNPDLTRIEPLQKHFRWDQTYSPVQRFDTARLANRFHKMLHFSALTHSDSSVYVDANVRPINRWRPFEAFGGFWS